MEQKEFQIESLPDYSFRTKKMRATEINAMKIYFDTEDIEKLVKAQDYALQHLEVNIKGQWLQVQKQEKNGEFTYWPGNLEDNVNATQELFNWFLSNVVFAVFQKSEELK